MTKSDLKFTRTEVEILRDNGYELFKKIGSGGYAKVYRGKFQRNDGKFIQIACKIIDESKAPKKFLVKFLPRELRILTKLNHPHIIEIHSIIFRKGRYYMFMRLAEEGDLLNYINQYGAVSENRSRFWIRQLALAIQYLHTMSIAHRDIKCENILITIHRNAKLSDFGFARYVIDFEDYTPILSETFCGSLSYAPPEILDNEPYSPKKADVWSLGVVLFIMLNKSNPFDGKKPKELLKKQLAKDYKFRSKYENSLSNEVKLLLGEIFVPDYRERLTIEEILLSKWIAMKPKLTKLTVFEHKALNAAIKEAKIMKTKEKQKQFTSMNLENLKYKRHSSESKAIFIVTNNLKLNYGAFKQNLPLIKFTDEFPYFSVYFLINMAPRLSIFVTFFLLSNNKQIRIKVKAIFVLQSFWALP